MKRNIILFLVVILSGILLIYSCSKDFLEKFPPGVVTEDVLASRIGINKVLIGAYCMLDGYAQGNPGGAKAALPASPLNWVSEMQSDNAYKGEVPENWSQLNELIKYNISVNNVWPENAWVLHYDGASRANDVLRIVKKAIEKDNITSEEANEFEAEGRFIRAYHHFQLQLKFFQVPYISEDVDPGTIKNDHMIWDEIGEDFQFAIDNLPGQQEEVGRVTKYAAMAMQARCYLFQEKYSEAKPLLDDIINGPFELMDNFYDNFDEEKQNNNESIFEIQYSVNDGSKNSQNGNWDYCLIYPRGGDINLVADYFHPSLDLYNAFKVNSTTGLPLLDTYQDNILVHDMGYSSVDAFILPDQTFDPRVDWTLGRRGIPFLDWGVHRGSDWSFVPYAVMGPFINKKVMFYKRNLGSLSTSTGWAKGVNANNFRAIRLAHIFLWRAEVAVEENDLETARQMVNKVRERASNNFVMGKVLTNSLPAGVTPVIDNNQPAANYEIEQYSSFPNQEYARKAVRMEIRLETAMEGFRFFDLRRWGIIKETLNKFIQIDSEYRTFLSGTSFDEPKDEYWPIPLNQVDLQMGVLVQDPNY